jgi:hypothetical protein
MGFGLAHCRYVGRQTRMAVVILLAIILLILAYALNTDSS